MLSENAPRCPVNHADGRTCEGDYLNDQWPETFLSRGNREPDRLAPLTTQRGQLWSWGIEEPCKPPPLGELSRAKGAPKTAKQSQPPQTHTPPRTCQRRTSNTLAPAPAGIIVSSGSVPRSGLVLVLY